MFLRWLLVNLLLLLLLGMLLCELLRLLLVLLLNLLFLCVVGVLLRQFLMLLLLLLLELLSLLFLQRVEFFLLLLVFLVCLRVSRIRRGKALCRRQFVRMDSRIRWMVLCVARRIVMSAFTSRYCAAFVESSRLGCGSDRRLSVICGSAQFRI